MAKTTVNLDLDGCAYDFDGTFARYCSKVLNQPRERFSKPLTWEFWTQWGLKEEEWRLLFGGYILEGGFNSAPPADGFAQTAYLLRKHGHRVFIVTARGSNIYDDSTGNAKAKKDTIEWLDNYSIEHDGLIFTSHKEGVSEGIFIDDYSKHLNDIRDAGYTAIAFDAPYNQDWNGLRVKSWRQAYDVISAIDGNFFDLTKGTDKLYE